ncbi:MAG TPA: dihydroorotase [Candidatus Limnocylindrales bacterium]|jgi:dihydroorotase
MTLDLDLSRVWLVDPDRHREGPADVVVRHGVIRAVRWLRGADASGVHDGGVVVAPAFVDLHAHLREPGNDAAETVATGLAAAAHGGFGLVCAMPNTEPAIDDAGALARLEAAVAAAAARASSGGEGHGLPAVRAWGAVTVDRAGDHLAPMAELAAAGIAGFSEDGAPVRSATVFRNALAYAGALGLPIVDHPEDLGLTEGAEAGEGLVATVLGLKGWPAAGEVSAVARDLAILEDVAADVPGARLHLTHLSVAGSFRLVREAKARGLPVTCDVTPHHLALSDEWVAGARRWAWDALDPEGRRLDPWGRPREAGPYDTSTRVNPPLRSPEDAAACRAAVRDGTADAIATDHAPHGTVAKSVEYGLAPNGISGIETALGVVLAAVAAGQLTLARAIEALTAGPRRVLAGPAGRPSGVADGRLALGTPASLVVFDRSATWTVSPATLRSKGKNSPLLGRSLAGRVLLTTSNGLVTYRDEALTP